MTSSKRRNFFIILILGTLTTVSPFSIDMYLPAFPQIAEALHTTTAQVAFSLSSYFVAIAFGQIFYGPLLDRYGRKKPVYAGLLLYILASVGCMNAHSVHELVVLRFFQGLGGCVAGVASMAMVRDFFPVKEGAKVFSLMMLVLGVSPLLAPTVGSFVAVGLGWQWVFILLAGIVAIIMAVTFFFLPEAHVPDETISLKPLPILRTFGMILRDSQFRTYTLAGSFAFAGLLVYVAASPIIFMEVYHVTAHQYGGIFALLAIGFIGGNQLNIFLGKFFSNAKIFRRALMVQCLVTLAFLIGSYMGIFTLWSTLALLFVYLGCAGLTYPNAAAIALAPFSKNAGSASALLGFLQLGIGALTSSGIGLFSTGDALPAAVIFFTTSIIGFAILMSGKQVMEVDTVSGDLDLI